MKVEGINGFQNATPLGTMSFKIDHTQLVSSFTTSLQTSRMAIRMARWAPTWKVFDAFSYKTLNTYIINVNPE